MATHNAPYRPKRPPPKRRQPNDGDGSIQGEPEAMRAKLPEGEEAQTTPPVESAASDGPESEDSTEAARTGVQRRTLRKVPRRKRRPGVKRERKEERERARETATDEEEEPGVDVMVLADGADIGEVPQIDFGPGGVRKVMVVHAGLRPA